MKKKLLSVLVMTGLALTAVSCGNSSSDIVDSVSSTASSTATSSTVSSTAAPSSSSTASSSSSVASSEAEIPADPTYSTSLPEGSEVREFNATFDKKVDDFSSKTSVGTVSGNAVYNSSPYLKVRLNSSNEVFPSSADASIYKQGEGTYPIKDYDGIGFTVKLHDSKKISNNQLVLALRGDDSCQVYQIPLNTALNPDAENLSSLTSDYQDLIVSPKQTISDENTVYKKTDGSDSTIKVLDTIVGFHLFATGKVDATLDIASVFLVKSGVKTVIDDFEHSKPNDGGANLWWRDSTGYIVSRQAEIKDNGSYAVNTEEVGKNLVLNIKGDSSTAKVTFKDGTHEVTKDWADLKDSSNKAIPATLTETFKPIVINLANSGIDFTPTSYSISSDKEVIINRIFLSDLVNKKAEEYAAIDQKDAKVFDSFNRSQTGFDGDYDASHASQTVIDAGLDYALSYNANTSNMVSADGTSLVFDASSLPADGFIQLKEGSDAHARTNEKYMVFSMKLTDGASLDNFRFGYGGSGVVYANNWYSAFMSKSVDTPYYSDADGYKWYVIDIAETGISEVSNMIDMYYSGTGKLYIDEIFFTDDYTNPLVVDNEDVNDGLHDAVVSTAGYHYQYGGNLGATADPVIALTLKGDGTSDLSSVRLELNGETKWFKDNAIIDTKGAPIDSTTALPTDNTTIYIDLVQSGFSLEGNGNLHIHVGTDTASGDITFAKLATYAYNKTTFNVASNKAVDTSGYSYVGWVGNAARLNSNGGKYLELNVKGDGTATLASLRLADGVGEFWVKDGKLILKDGSALDAAHVISEDGETIVIDLVKSGLSFAGDIHAHIGGDGYTGTITFTSIDVVLDNPSYSTIFSSRYSD